MKTFPSAPSGQVLERIEATAFERWLVTKEAAVTVELDPNPLGLPPSPAPVGLPSEPPLPTPNLPAIPGPPSAAGNPYQLPTLPAPVVPGLP